jgi:hypothetical protein
MEPVVVTCTGQYKHSMGTTSGVEHAAGVDGSGTNSLGFFSREDAIFPDLNS